MSELQSSWRRLPSATYRLQFNRQFDFQRALELADYLHELGISDCYASPLLQARPESPHGYDVCDCACLNLSLGALQDFDRWNARLRQLDMGLLLDIVPNHMGADRANPWWLDVLQNGEASAFAAWFDIDWRSPGLEGKVLLPILEDHYAKVLEAGKLSLRLEADGFAIAYYDRRFPVSRPCYGHILTQLASLSRKRSRPSGLIKELQTFASAFNESQSDGRNSSLPFGQMKQNFSAWIQEHLELREDVSALLRRFKGEAGNANSFDELHDVLQQQHYRLAYWRIGPERINYRRFFDITELVSLRVELPHVFDATHELILRLVDEGKVAGLRIDHPDGLWSPRQYLERLQVAVRTSGPPLYVVVEKILTGEEALPADWPVAGTTGYDFLNQVNGLFVNPENSNAFAALYRDFTGSSNDFAEIVYASKKRILLTSFISELDALTRRLEGLAANTRAGRDFTRGQIRAVLVEVLSCFPVYRTYIDEQTSGLLKPERDYIVHAVRSASRRAPELDPEITNFLEQILLLESLPELDKPGDKNRRQFIMRFQQLTGPLMAKGLEDTAFYNFNRLISLNEVGGDPGRFGTDVDAFHAFNRSNRDHWPHSLLTTATHDTKRGEDARARINVLSEMPAEWGETLSRWRTINQRYKTMVDTEPAPRLNDEYLLYQSLLGAWTFEHEAPGGLKQFGDRMSAYMLKALRESKANSSWTNPNKPYEEATLRFLEHLLEERSDNLFLNHFKPFQRRIAFFGQFNSLSQTLLKVTAPGVPDFYQGTELWDLSLVDPDNRHPIDYQQRRQLLSDLKNQVNRYRDNMGELFAKLFQKSCSGQLKLFLIWRALHFRQNHRKLFEEGSYVPLSISGSKRNHVCAFARVLGGSAMIVVVPRLVVGLTDGQERPPLGQDVWQGTGLKISNLNTAQGYRDIFTEGRHAARQPDDSLPVADILSHFPVAVLERVG